MKLTKRPDRNPFCVFCEYWMGDAEMEFISRMAGYKFEGNAKGKCAKSGVLRTAVNIKCRDFEYSREAKKLL